MNKVAILEKRIKQENSIEYFPRDMNYAMSFAEAAYSSLYLLPIHETFIYVFILK